jgi:hypothetical protein
VKHTSPSRCRSRSLSTVFGTTLLVAGVAFGAAFGASAHEGTDISATQPSSAAVALKPTHTGPLVQVYGTLALIHSDDFARGRSTQSLVIHEDNGRDTPVRFGVNAPAVGARVSVTGTLAADGALDVVGTTVLSEATAAPKTLSAVRSQNALFILVEFLDTTSVPFTQAAVQAVAVSNSNSVQNYYQEVSFGYQALNITVTPWLVAQMSTSTTCNYTSIASAANNAATAAGYNLANYTYKFYVMPYNSACGWMGLAYVGSPYQAWSNGYNSLQVYTHELGHNFTLYHAGSLNCGTQVLGGTCSVAEYGDLFDTMGNQQAMHYNSAQKTKLGWLPSSSVVTHNGGTVDYTLTPIESGGGTTYAVKIAAASNRTYWVEYRQPLGFDVNLANYPNNGVEVRLSSPFQASSGTDDTELLDMTPGSAGGFGDATLLAGHTYTDSTYGITISVLSAYATAATVQVSSPSLVATSTALASSLDPATVGSSVTFTATVSGSSPGGNVIFASDGSAFCSAALSSGVARCSTSSLAAGTHSIVASYGGDSANAGSTSPSLSQIISAVTDTTSPVVTIMSPGNGSTVSGMVTISAQATDNVAVASITLSLDGAVVATTNASSVSYRWNTRKAAKGAHTITAVARDTSGNQKSATVQVQK